MTYSVIANLCDRVCVMKYGEMVEEGSVRDIYLNPQQDYTRKLISAIPLLDQNRLSADDVPDVPLPAMELERVRKEAATA